MKTEEGNYSLLFVVWNEMENMIAEYLKDRKERNWLLRGQTDLGSQKNLFSTGYRRFSGIDGIV